MLAFTFRPSGAIQATGAPFAGVRNGGWLSAVTLISFGGELMADMPVSWVQSLKALSSDISRHEVQLPHRVLNYIIYIVAFGLVEDVGSI